jgi:hypothetical protein
MQSNLFLVAALLGAAALPAQTVTHYWIDAVNGSDTNPGTQALPFKSLTFAAGVQLVDVHLHVLPGVYGPTTTGDFWDLVTNAPKQLRLANFTNLTIAGVDRDTCILDFEGGNGPWGFVNITSNSTGVEISHLTMRNAGVAPWANGAIVVDYGAQTVDIHNCYFEQTYSTFIIWRGYDVAFHDNVITDAVPNTGAWPSVGVRIRTDTAGDRTYIYNNTFYAIGQGISWSNYAGNPQQWIMNNVVLNGTGMGFPDSNYPGPHVVFENNLAFNCTTWNYNPVIGPNGTAPLLAATNLEVDPMLANAPGGDYSLLPGSPCIDSGSTLMHPYTMNDYAGNNRAVDSDENRTAIPDRGAIETTDLVLSVSNFAQGQAAIYDIQSANLGSWTFGALLLNLRAAPTYHPWLGMAGLDPLGLASVVAIPGMQFPLALPANPALDGVWVYAQYVGLKLIGTTAVLKGSGLCANVL